MFVAIFYECEDPTIRPLLASYGAVALAESFQRVCCYLLSKLDRPKRAIKEIESPNALWVPLLAIFIAIVIRSPDLTDCSVSNSTCKCTCPKSHIYCRLTLCLFPYCS